MTHLGLRGGDSSNAKQGIPIRNNLSCRAKEYPNSSGSPYISEHRGVGNSRPAYMNHVANKLTYMKYDPTLRRITRASGSGIANVLTY